MELPGLFDRKVSFCTVQSVKSDMGAPSKVYNHAFYMYMKREQAPSYVEQYTNNRLVVPTRYLYKGYYKSTINESMQLVDEGIKYNILSVNPTGGSDEVKKIFIELLVERITE